MSSRATWNSILAVALALALTPARTAWSAVAPADSTAPAAAAPDSSAAKASGSAETTQTEAAPADTGSAKSSTQSESKESSAKAEKSASAKKGTKKSKPKADAHKSKAVAAEKGTKSVDSGVKAGTMPVKPDVLPQHVQVQHILIGFSGSVPGKGITRTKEEAKKLAYEILDRARKGEDFDELVRKFTDDSPPGIYGMAGNGVAPAPGEYARSGMVAAFGNVGFAISPGNIGIADYDPAASPFGWHIIKRLK